MRALQRLLRCWIRRLQLGKEWALQYLERQWPQYRPRFGVFVLLIAAAVLHPAMRGCTCVANYKRIAVHLPCVPKTGVVVRAELGILSLQRLPAGGVFLAATLTLPKRLYARRAVQRLGRLLERNAGRLPVCLPKGVCLVCSGRAFGTGVTARYGMVNAAKSKRRKPWFCLERRHVLSVKSIINDSTE